MYASIVQPNGVKNNTCDTVLLSQHSDINESNSCILYDISIINHQTVYVHLKLGLHTCCDSVLNIDYSTTHRRTHNTFEQCTRAGLAYLNSSKQT